MSKIRFEELSVSSETKRAILAMGYEFATEIQSKAIPLVLSGLDIIGRSQTGTGKTLAFGIPAIETVENKSKAAQVLILCPTRELVLQVNEELHKLTKFKNDIKIADVYGGVPMDHQIQKLKRASIVVGTPGRLLDHTRRGTLKLNNLKMVILDEADEMLSMGFREDIGTILDQTPLERQTILFSATMPPEIFALTHKYQKSPKLVEVNKNKVTLENISQFYYDVPMGRKLDALNLLLKFYLPSRAIIFCNTKKTVDDVTEYLLKHGFSACGIHGDMKQSQRTKVMNSFKQGRTKILIATDVAARGIDVDNVDYVINYDVPQNTEYYVHRIGRTGRAGKVGTAITICSGSRQADVLLRIGKLVKSKISYKKMPSFNEIHKKIYDSELDEIEAFIKNTVDFKRMKMLKDLLDRGYEVNVIAAAALQKYFGDKQYDFETFEVSNLKNDKPYRKIVINIGRAKRIAPNHIVAAITGQTQLKGKDIGKIEIFDDKTIVSVPEKDFEKILSGMKNCRICGNKTVTKVYKGNRKN